MILRSALLVSICVVLGRMPLALADEGEKPDDTRVKLEEVKPDRNKLSEDNVDEILTNNLLRAQTGSKSRWSISNSINYNGGTIDDPLNAHIPNISMGTGLTSVANLADSISVKYRFNAGSSILAGVGARWITPFNGTQVPTNYNGNKYDAQNPYAKYQYVYRWLEVQNAFSVGPTVFTNTNLTRMGYLGNVVVQQTSVYEIGQTGLSVGAGYDVIYTTYNSESTPYRSQISDYAFAVNPFVEYQLTAAINLRTYWAMWGFEHFVSEGRALTFHEDVLTQSVGVGIKVIRDVFLYPNVSFVPYKLRSDLTNVGISANINLF